MDVKGDTRSFLFDSAFLGVIYLNPVVPIYIYI